MEQQEDMRPTSYYVDFENVHGAGLAGIDELPADAQVLVFYSKAADAVHIEHVVNILSSAAEVRFVEADPGIRNSLDFQLITALFGTIDPEREYVIVSGDAGFDAAIKMAQRLGLPKVTRQPSIDGTSVPATAKKSRRRKKSGLSSSSEQSSGTKAVASEEKEGAAQAEQKVRGREAEEADSAAVMQADEPSEDGVHEEATVTDGADAVAVDEAASPSAAEAAGGEDVPAKSAEPNGGAQGEPSATEGGAVMTDAPDAAPAEKEPESAPARESGRRPSRRRRVAALLEKVGAGLSQEELSVVMQAVNNARNKQGFYQRIVKEEGRQKGLELYHRVRDSYDAIAEIVRD